MNKVGTVLVGGLGLASSQQLGSKDRSVYLEHFHNWIGEHKIEPKNGADFSHMLENFARNHDIIEAHNSKNLPYTLGHNKFSHLSLEEFRAHVRLGLNKPQFFGDATHGIPEDVSANPASVDWRASGAVTPVKDQGQCGSCWSFSATGAMEGAYQIKYKDLVSFSEQELVDCDNIDGGCNGGLMDHAFVWTKKNGGLCTEEAYPYVSGTTKTSGSCSEKCTKNANVAPQGHTSVTPNSDAAMMSALAQQPVSVAIEADETAFQLYKSGVLTAACGSNIDHGVLAVGYGSENGLDYYIVKNSWGANWGESGYIRLARGSSVPPEGQCGILTAASYPRL